MLGAKYLQLLSRLKWCSIFRAVTWNDCIKNQNARFLLHFSRTCVFNKISNQSIILCILFHFGKSCVFNQISNHTLLLILALRPPMFNLKNLLSLIILKLLVSVLFTWTFILTSWPLSIKCLALYAFFFALSHIISQSSNACQNFISSSCTLALHAFVWPINFLCFPLCRPSIKSLGVGLQRSSWLDGSSQSFSH